MKYVSQSEEMVAGKAKTRESRGMARYANFFQVGHNAYEFLLEFGQQDSEIHTRIYLSPQHAQMLSELLNAALREHSLLTHAPSKGEIQ